MHPLFPTLANLADYFLSYTISKDIMPVTLDNVKACILLTIKVCTNVDFTQNYELAAICTKYHRECPPEVFKVPDWNLVLVLEVLSKPPFEPLHEVSLKMLTLKCCFLISLALSCRVSELHALAFDKISHSPNWSRVYLEPKSDFLAKNQTSHSDKQSRAFILKSLVPPPNKTQFSPGSFEEKMYHKHKLLCPVRALRLYLHKTALLRANKAALFISMNPNHPNDITKQSICNWVRRTIKLCYALAGKDDRTVGRATVHECRAITSSVKFERNLSLDSLLKSCTWKHGNVFTKHYLRNVAVLSQDLYRLPPVYLSQCKLNT